MSTTPLPPSTDLDALSDFERSAGEAKALEWHKMDPEQRLGFTGGRYTTCNKSLSLLASLLLTGIFFAVAVFALNGVAYFQPFCSILLERGSTQYIAVLFFFLVLVMLWFKSRKLSFQKRAFGLPIMPADASFTLSP
jgi:hypothetical protein